MPCTGEVRRASGRELFGEGCARVRMRLCLLVAMYRIALACDGADSREEGASKASAGAPGVSLDSIRLGVLTDESGPTNAFALARLRAARVFFQALNDGVIPVDLIGETSHVVGELGLPRGL